MLPFDEELAALSAEEFAERMLRGIGAETVAAGETFRFGRGREGDLDLLARLGFDVRRVPLVENVSSSRVRELVHAGEPERAAELLGRPPEVEGDRRPRGRTRPRARVSDREPRRSGGASRPAGRRLRRLGARPSRGRLDRHEPALRRRRAPGRGASARLRRRSVRAAARRRDLGADPGAAPLRLARGARICDRRRRLADEARRSSRLSGPGAPQEPRPATRSSRCVRFRPGGSRTRWLMSRPPANP